MESEDNKRIYARIVAKAWADDAFKEKFLHDPTKIAREFGMKLHPNTTVLVVHEGRPYSVDHSGAHAKLVLLLPPKPVDLIEHIVLGHSLSSFITSKSCVTGDGDGDPP